MTRLSYALRKYPAARFIALAFIVATGILILSLFTRNVARKPIIESITPNVGLPGEILVIKGKSFGNKRDSSYVELCGNRITESGYISWGNEEIKIIIPTNTEDGLVYVVNRGGKSNPDFFANESAIPVAMPSNSTVSVPTISDISPEKPYIGQVLTISGENFGSERGNSSVYFSYYKDSSNENTTDFNSLGTSALKKSATNTYTAIASKYAGFIKPSEEDYDYEYWSETEIRVRVPDGAQTGSVFVVTDNGQSPMQPITVRRFAGEKRFRTKHTYVVQVESEITNIKGKKDATITLHVPIPAAFSQQPEISITESKPEPMLLYYKGSSIFQVAVEDETKRGSFKTKQNFVVECAAVETWFDKNSIDIFREKNRMLYRTYTRADDIIPADDYELKSLLPKIIFQIKNPYRQAELIFDYITENYKLLSDGRVPTASPKDLIRRKRGDAYDFAVIYTALLRAAGIPARVLSGILINSNKTTKKHWWTEFYIEGFGWVPADVAIGAGLEFEAFQNEKHSKKYYFGNIDAQHIAFSLNYSVLKPSILNNKVVFIPRSYASQSVWEESSADIEGYSSYWPTPIVLGIY